MVNFRARTTRVRGYMETPERYQRDHEKLSAGLRELRNAAGLTGREAAKRAGMSQPKISKIENALLLPSAADVETLLHVYGAPQDEFDALLDLAAVLHTTYESNRTIVRRGAARRQRQIAQLEAEASSAQYLSISLIPTLLQTAEYARRVFALDLTGNDLARALDARLERQHVLYRESKSLSFLLTEAALRWRFGPAEVMRTQLLHIASLSTLPNVSIGIVPWSAEVPVVPMHNFEIFDDKLVTVTLETVSMTFQDPQDVLRHGRLYAGLDKVALKGDEARSLLSQIAEEFRTLD
jgi:transcriptional regulator with XRE-family HTH domain